MIVYFVGIGSNISPHHNIPTAITSLLQLSRRIVISRVIQTIPVRMLDDQHYFLNAVVMFKSTLDKQSLKNRLNEIESQLGRDRSDPAKKVKDRTLDLDILLALEENQRVIDFLHLPTEPYLCEPFIDLVHFLMYQCSINNHSTTPGVALMLENHCFGISESVIDIDVHGVISVATEK